MRKISLVLLWSVLSLNTEALDFLRDICALLDCSGETLSSETQALRICTRCPEGTLDNSAFLGNLIRQYYNKEKPLTLLFDFGKEVVRSEPSDDSILSFKSDSQTWIDYDADSFKTKCKLSGGNAVGDLRTANLHKFIFMAVPQGQYDIQLEHAFLGSHTIRSTDQFNLPASHNILVAHSSNAKSVREYVEAELRRSVTLATGKLNHQMQFAPSNRISASQSFIMKIDGARSLAPIAKSARFFTFCARALKPAADGPANRASFKTSDHKHPKALDLEKKRPSILGTFKRILTPKKQKQTLLDVPHFTKTLTHFKRYSKQIRDDMKDQPMQADIIIKEWSERIREQLAAAVEESKSYSALCRDALLDMTAALEDALS